MIEVLSVASEAFPLVKTGGLADVAGALPGALSGLDVQMRTLLPNYPAVNAHLKSPETIAEIDDLFGGHARLLAEKVSGLDLIVIDAPHLYERGGGIYAGEDGADWPDNWQRFAALSWVGASLGQGLVKGYRPQIIHAHDWQAGLVPAYVAFGSGRKKPKTIMTVHNLAFQGQYGPDIFPQLKLPPRAFSVDGVEYYGGVGFLKAGLQCADALTTVSPTYAAEVRTPEFGMGLDGLLRSRASSLHGILNGIDEAAWDPGSDENLIAPFRVSTVAKRSQNKLAVQARFGIHQDDSPLFAIVSRLTWQKGIDLMAQSVDLLVELGAQLCVLGSGEPALEAAMQAAADRHPGRVGVIKGYNEGLSHLMQGGADAVLVPSRFEPCGLTQLIGLRYGCVPVVARTGGLADTVIDANTMALNASVATGVQFSPVTATALGEALRRTVALYRQPQVWSKMQRRGMKTDVCWGASAQVYAELYHSLLGRTAKDDDQDD